MFRVTVQFGDSTLGDHEFDQEVVTIGRDAACDLVVDNARASRHHAAIERTHRGYVLADLSSHNGTYVDGKKVRRHRLEDADRFVIGRYSFRFEQVASGHGDETDLSFRSESDEGAEAAPATGTDLATLLRRVRADEPTQLVQLTPAHLRRNVALGNHYAVIGRDASCDIRIDGWLIPRKAGLIVRTGSGHCAIGTSRRFRVNGAVTDAVRLADGDLITVGRNRFRYCRS